MITIIAAYNKNKSIGKNNQLIYHIKDDLKHFKELTTNHTIIMGRNTYNSLQNGALPNRRNIIISKSISDIDNCEVFNSIEEALNNCNKNEEIFIIGGASIYNQTINLADKLEITYIYDNLKGDVFFPEFNIDDFIIEKESKIYNNLKDNIHYKFITYLRKNK